MKRGLIIVSRLDTWAGENPRIGALMRSEYGELLKTAYDALDVSVLYQSWIHGNGHIERTMLLGAMLAHALELSEHESRMLLLCCSYHDIGRHDDSVDKTHGDVSAQMLTSEKMQRKFEGFNRYDFRVMQAAISLHSRSDREIETVACRYGIEAYCLERYYRLAKCLKDADNLDRVRLGDLDPRHLRHPESKELVPDAHWIYDRY